MASGESAITPDIGMMREHIVLCDGHVEPSPDQTLEVVQKRSPLSSMKAQVVQVRRGRISDYRQDAVASVYDHYICFRAVPGLLLTVKDYVFWAERRPHFEADVWFKIVEIGELIHRHRFTVLNCQLHTRYFPNDRGLSEVKPLRDQEPLY